MLHASRDFVAALALRGKGITIASTASGRFVQASSNDNARGIITYAATHPCEDSMGSSAKHSAALSTRAMAPGGAHALSYAVSALNVHRYTLAMPSGPVNASIASR